MYWYFIAAQPHRQLYALTNMRWPTAVSEQSVRMRQWYAKIAFRERTQSYGQMEIDIFDVSLFLTLPYILHKWMRQNGIQLLVRRTLCTVDSSASEKGEISIIQRSIRSC